MSSGHILIIVTNINVSFCLVIWLNFSLKFFGTSSLKPNIFVPQLLPNSPIHPSFASIVWPQSTYVSKKRDKQALSFFIPLSPSHCAAWHMMMQRDRNVSSSSYSLISLLFLSIASSSPLKGACWDFTEGACDLSEHNILDHDRFVDSPEECQVAIIIDLKRDTGKKSIVT